MVIEPKVSIIIPVFNTELYVAKCINSVINQEDFEHFEVIIINDGTTDRSMDIIKGIIANHQNIKVIHQENRGLSEARNAGLKEATGKYVSFIDSDDWIEPEMLAVLCETAIRTNSEIAVCNMRALSCGGAVEIRNMGCTATTGATMSSVEAISHYFGQTIITGHVCNKIFKRALFTSYDVSFPAGKKYEDMPVCFELLWHADRIVFVNEVFYNYVQRDGSITRQLTGDLWHLIDSVYSIKDSLILKGKYESMHNQFSQLLISKLFAVYIQLRKNKLDEAYGFLEGNLKKELQNIRFSSTLMPSEMSPLIKVKYIAMKMHFDHTVDFLLLIKSRKHMLKRFYHAQRIKEQAPLDQKIRMEVFK